MSNKVKTIVNNNSVEDFLNTLEDSTKRQDGFKLLEIYALVTSEPPMIWGSSIIGYGKYQVKSGSQINEWPLAAFSPRKQTLTLYVMSDTVDHSDLLKDLGKHSTSKACLYINKLADVDLKVLQKIIERSYLDVRKTLLN